MVTPKELLIIDFCAIKLSVILFRAENGHSERKSGGNRGTYCPRVHKLMPTTTCACAYEPPNAVMSASKTNSVYY